MAGRLSITKRFTFEAAHTLKGYPGNCGRLHGHSYKLEVTVEHLGEVTDVSDALTRHGMLVDFAHLKGVVEQEVINKLDHSNLNESAPIQWVTAEGLIYWIAEHLRRVVERRWPLLRLSRLRLWETEDSYAEWRRCDCADQ